MKLPTKIFLISIIFAIIPVFLIVLSIHQIAKNELERVFVHTMKNPQEDKVRAEIFNTLTKKMISQLIPVMLGVLLFIGGVAVLLFFHIKYKIKIIESCLGIMLNELKTHQDFNEYSTGASLPHCIVELLQAAFQLSQLNLTVKISTSNEMIAPLAEAIEKMAKAISHGLLQIRVKLEKITSVSHDIRQTNMNIATVMSAKREVVKNLRLEIVAMGEVMSKIAKVVQASYQLAQPAVVATNVALAISGENTENFNDILLAMVTIRRQIGLWHAQSQKVHRVVSQIDSMTAPIYLKFKQLPKERVSKEIRYLCELMQEKKSQLLVLVHQLKEESEQLMTVAAKNLIKINEIAQSLILSRQQIMAYQNTVENWLFLLASIKHDCLQSVKIHAKAQAKINELEKNFPPQLVALKLQITHLDNLVHDTQQARKLFEVFHLSTSRV